MPARVPEDLDEIRALCREYAASLPYSLCFQGFDEEMAGLPGAYAPPAGRLLVARTNDRDSSAPLLGCVALRPLATDGVRDGDPHPVCEMKRMYVRPPARGTGLGRRLCARILDEARLAGYRFMKLDSDANSMVAAIALYRSVGFTDIPAYNDDPMEGTVWLGRAL